MQAHNDEILKHLPLVRSIARKLCDGLPSYVELCDLVQAGVFGLSDAICGFDPTRGGCWSTYAYTRIRGSILDYLRETSCWAPRILRDAAKASGHKLARMVLMEREHKKIPERETHNSVDEMDSFERWIKRLPYREKTVVRLRFLEDLTFKEIGSRMVPPLSERRVHQLYHSAENTLRCGDKANRRVALVTRRFVSNQI